ncbi:MAG: alpha/beta hydrolase [Mycolicibacterium insubricum]|nr:alpha/beta hydrolase [Mycobacterium sp.]
MSVTDIHPELRRAARLAPKAPVRPWTIPIVRAATERMSRRRPRGVTVLTTTDGIGVRLHRPPNQTAPAPALLWIHGGGYVIGTAAMDDELCRRFAERLGIVVAAVDYRLAPEHPYPAGLDDCYSGLGWLTRLPAVDPSRIAIGGASAGGGLAAALALHTRDRAEIALAGQLLVYPMLDDRSSHHDCPQPPGLRLWNRRSNAFGWRSYLGDADPAIAVPGRRTDLAGLPPTWIGVGNQDLFHDEDLAYADALSRAGVPCAVTVVPGAFHGFDGLAPGTELVRRWFDDQCDWLRTTLLHERPIP